MPQSRSALFSAMILLSACAATPPETSTSADVPLSADVLGYRADLEELAGRIKAEHPRPWRFVSEAEFDALVERGIADMGPHTTHAEFLWAFSEVLASIECGHSRMPWFIQEDALIAPEDRFPVELRRHEGRLFVLDPLASAGQLSVGDEVVKINGRRVADILAEIERHIVHEGVSEEAPWPLFNVFATSYLTYELGFPEAYEVKVAARRRPVRLAALDAFSPKPIFHPEAACRETLCYRVDEASNAGIMTMHSFAFYGERGQVFVDFVDAAFADLVEEDRDALVIDMRAHDGGSGLAGAYILRRLADAPFAFYAETSDPRGREELFEVQRPVDVGFDAPVYLVVDEDTVSAAPHFAALFKEHAMGEIIGVPMGGNKSTNDGKLWLKSSAHGVEYTVARMRFDVEAPSQSMDAPVTPDEVRKPTLQDRLTGSDSVMDGLLGRIAGGS